MKKIYSLLISALLISGISQAQSLSASNVYVSGPVFMMEGHATITNNSGTAKDVLVQRTINNIVPGHVSYFCWFECYGETTSLAPDPINIPAGSSTSIFKAYLESNLIPGISYVKYCFFDMANTSDSVCVDYVFDASTGISEVPTDRNFISKPYPNPAKENTSFLVNLNKGSKGSRIKIFNMLGAEVKDIPVTDSRNSVKINVADLKSGVYFYSLWVNNKSTGTGKLMISRD
jgi:hypothetical protein